MIFIIFIYVIFVTELAKEVKSPFFNYPDETFTLVESEPLSIGDSFISTALLLPLKKQNNQLLIALHDQNSPNSVIPLRNVTYIVLLGLLFPLSAFIIISCVVFTLAVNYQRSKLDKILMPMCAQAEDLIVTFGRNSTKKKSYSALSQLNIYIEDLTKYAKIYQINSEQSAYCDKLTSLINRHKFLEHINEQIAIADETKTKCGLLFIDLDGFKQVNDSFGHSFGDEVLIQVAERLRSVVRSQNLNFSDNEEDKEYNLSRLGGDEFTLFIQNIDDPEIAVNIAKHVLKELERDFVLGNKLIKISASIGIAAYPDSANSPDALVQMADVAMYRAKKEGRGIYRIYSPEMGSKLRRYHYLLEEMRLGIASNSFFLAFQPIIHVDGCAISYFEALVRWQHPIEGIVTPAEFIPIAEDSNQILVLGDWILNEACRQMAAWHNAGMTKTKISVNVSGVQLKHRPIYDWVMDTLNKTGLPPKSLMLEITESCFIDISDNIISELEKLRKEGVFIAIDDFGTGFSSLSVLATLPVDVLKIDRMFVSEASHNEKYRKILKSIVELSQRLDLKIVAEGIEEVIQLELLKSLGVVYIQGYLISRPESSKNVGNKVLKQGMNHLAHMGTGTWTPSTSRVI
ncbi:putative bifunctional diguanylate cyclase/phosphodiesterase [Pseudocolwellia agarivorans]|uniref:putative bifunctional diguanylate cyclase/phosphodiesterase n=1 Tax=Pseudocolwellia agarivorans TaxID=1911682 RepID=UPI001FE684E1|nr:EAL domain-containing protein [Pseudocolwellia agarivorans]